MKIASKWVGVALLMVPACASPGGGSGMDSGVGGASANGEGSTSHDGDTDSAMNTTVDAAGDGRAEAASFVPDAGSMSDAACLTGTLSCNGQQPALCAGSGVWRNVGSPCSGNTPTCLEGACVECAPGDAQCSGDAVVACNASGMWGSPIPCLQPTPACSPVSQPATCVCPIGDAICSGGCVDEKTDPNNCGGCAVTCNGTCSSSHCVVSLAAALNPTGIALDANNVYWTNTNSPGTVMSVPIGGAIDGGIPTILALSQNGPGPLVVDSENVYWTTCGSGSTDGTVMSVPIGGAPDGGAPTTLASGQNCPTGIAVNGTNVFWTAPGATAFSGSLMSTPILGGPVKTLVTSTTMQFLGVAANANAVYWTQYDSSAVGTVMSMPAQGLPDGGAAITVASAQDAPWRIVVNSVGVYWTTSTSIKSMFIDGGPPTTLASGQNGPVAIAVDDTSIYWSNQRSGSGPDGTLMKAPLSGIPDGGVPTTLASGLYYAFGIAVDDTSVYWTQYEKPSALMKITPK